MKVTCDCGTPLDVIKGKGYTFTACPKGHYEHHEAHGDKLKDSDWAKDVIGWFAAPEPPPRRPVSNSMAGTLARDAIKWAEGQLDTLMAEYPGADLRVESWIKGQEDLKNLTASSGVLEITDAIGAYKQRVTAYLGKWRKKLQSQSSKS